ncbi:iron-containing alcohol dehydrogenase [Peptoniphilus stercorisuis]|uniref:Alcohol dehydrogenase class IV n=1 Tax=Peptoniphilus stercorisuis TaxID=1436965 RepID=A0ABS4KC75_9FIRM|nr:iron-containing alcohol dehydrogenase [Peptoniphilus stercorisuis]MBP2025378.1 alcohol dehydrogenase class IV [Peptoniphilus stercorisuis]
MYNVFSVPKEIIQGDNALEYLASLEGKKASIVTGGSSMRRFGFLDEATKELEKAGMEVQIIDGVEPDPSIETCINGGKKMAEFNPDWIIALGGGSAMDAAKIMWVFYEYPDYDFYELVKFNFPKLRTKAKLIGIPSTSGTASEITAFSVITDVENDIKYPLVSPDLIPDVAILDNRIPSKMPAKITAQTGMDVMTHAIEAFVSTNANDFTDPYAIRAVEIVFEYLQKAVENPDDLDVRAKMHTASTIAGMAFSNVSLGIVHSMAHKIGGIFHLTHGEANAIMLPYIIQYNKKSTDKYKELEERLGIENIEKAIWELNKKIGIAESIKAGKNTIIEEDAFVKVLDTMSKNAFEDACTLTNPRETSPEDIKKIYKCAYYGEKVDF